MGTPKLPARYAALVMPLLLSLLMTFVVSLISTLRSIGLAPDLLVVWLSAWGLSWRGSVDIQHASAPQGCAVNVNRP